MRWVVGRALGFTLAVLAVLPAAADERRGSRSSPEDRARADEIRALAQALSHCQLHVSRELMARAVLRTMDEDLPVRYAMKGIPIGGTAHVTGATQVALVPDAGRVVFDVMFHGKAVSTTVAQADPVRIHAKATTTFTARKRVVIDHRGVTSHPAQCNARTRSTITHISSRLPGLRGQVARWVADRQARDDKAEADRFAQRYTQRLVCRQFDADFQRETGWLLAALDEALDNGRLAARLAGPATCRELRLATTADHWFIGGLPRQRSAELPAPASGALFQLRAAATDMTAVMGGVGALVNLAPPGLTGLASGASSQAVAARFQLGLSFDGGALCLSINGDGDRPVATMATRP